MEDNKVEKELGPALTWDELADLYNEAHPNGPPAKTIPMKKVFKWAQNQPDRFQVEDTVGNIHVMVIKE